MITAYSGHEDLSQLSAYLEVRDEQILGAAATLSMLSPIVGKVGKVRYSDLKENILSTPSENSSFFNQDS
ncbi:hypothetical protein [Coleofasciculus sp. FACHB-129]|uniref:hypothetical protein n=1 Tax=Cyanophyceae TaxID=3028117 RepID=UPI00168927E3|nr:hypothetical protein [Coleofasciculus sp. FACHB-129]MBD1893117.1 hypothetical protein [Coleofasciculus sp. FACHB-129]